MVSASQDKQEDAAQPEFAAGASIGRYRVEEPVGQGGMGTVYRVFDASTNRYVAMKILAPGLSEALRGRFIAECEAQAKIRHEHVMPVYDQGWLTDERPYFTMELLYNPITLTDIIEHRDRGALSKTWPRLRHWADPARLISDVLLPVMDGIAVSNVDYRLQHRDLKPDNILIDVRTRRAYVIDFGICRELDDTEDLGKIVGTPRFLSPEQARGATDDRTDVWGLGAILYYAIAGEPPIRRSSPFHRREVRDRIAALQKAEQQALDEGREERAKALAARRSQFESPEFRALEDLYVDAREGNYLPVPPDTAPALAAIIRKAMAPQPSARYENARELVGDVRSWLSGDAVRALAETSSRQATMRRWQRVAKRHLVSGAAVAIGLILGTVLGAAVFNTPPTTPDYRQQDLARELAQLEQAIDRAAASWSVPRSPRESRAVWEALGHGLEGARRHVPLLAEEARAAAAARVDALAARLVAPRLTVTLPKGRQGIVIDLLAATARRDVRERQGQAITPKGMALAPGLYLISSEGNPRVQRMVVVPLPPNLEAERPLELTVDIPAASGGLPDGMTLIDALPQQVPLLASAPVTCEQYAAYLDEIPADARRAAVPPTGFHQGDPTDSSRWLATVEMANQPVIGIRPIDAAAYARWKANTYGLALRLPTPADYQRMLGVGLLPEAAWPAAVPGLAYPTPGHGVEGGPYGVTAIHHAPAEILATSESAFVLAGSSGREGQVALPVAGRRKTAPAHALPADQPVPGTGFRLVMSLE